MEYFFVQRKLNPVGLRVDPNREGITGRVVYVWSDFVLVLPCRCFSVTHHPDAVVDVVVVPVLLAVVVVCDVRESHKKPLGGLAPGMTRRAGDA